MTNLYKELEYTENVEEVTGLQFSIFSPEEIIRRSVAEITTQETYINNEPVIGGLFDPRMGVLDHNTKCKSCEQRGNFCPGHFGHIKLARPVFFVHFLSIIQKILKCVCLRCSSLLLDTTSNEFKTLLKKKGKNRWVDIFKLSQNIKRCGQCEPSPYSNGGCGAKQPDKICKDGFAKLYAEWKGDDDTGKKQHLSPELILTIFKRMSDETIEILGFSKNWCRPEWMICSVLPVPPPAVRPSVKQDNNQRMDDDLTHKLIDIIKNNKTLKQKISNNANDGIIDEWTLVVQYHVATYIDNEIPGISPAQQRSGRPLKSIRQRLKSKEGRVRGNLMGKRVDFSARSVITPDPNINIDELGVPFKIAMNLTFPEVVNKFNKKKLLAYTKNGPDIYPGAKSIKKIDGNSYILKHVDLSTIELENGDIVNRHLIDGDIVLFNRQPTLHRMSMMAHRVKVMKHSTFRLNVSVTAPYNADFDGDEMNMHVPQSFQSQIEIEELASVPSQIISPKDSKPIIGIVQDTLLGIYRITQKNQFFTEQQMMHLLMWYKDFNGILPEPSVKLPIKKWSGHQLLSIILPEINIKMPNKKYDEDVGPNSENYVKINDGNIEQGVFDKDILTKNSRGLVHVIYNDYGQDETKKFLDNVQYIITNYLLITGFSCGISDLIADPVTMRDMKNTIEDKKKEVESIIQQVHLNIFENLTGKPNSEHFEMKVNNVLNRANREAGKLGLKSLDTDNRFVNMVNAGSKGSDLNISQMIACLGQQNIDGKRIPYGFSDRTLPHYCKYDDGPEARGFVENSFIHGLTPQEFFFHAMGGREGLIDTAVKTSETGYIQRKLVKAMEDLKVNYDLTVRNAGGNIVQFLYGEDGIDCTKIESQIIDSVSLKYPQLEAKYKFNEDEKWNIFMTKEAIKEMKSNKKWKQQINDGFSEILKDRDFVVENVFRYNYSNSVFYPVNLSRLIINCKNKFKIDESILSDLNPFYVLEKKNQLANKLIITKHNNGNELFKVLLNIYLNPTFIIKHLKLNKVCFDTILLEIENKFKDSIVQPGDMVGAIAAQSIGEPATQMTLNTFHFAGIGSKSNITRGVPRIRELLSLSKNQKNPSLTIYMNPEVSVNTTNKHATNIKYNLELTILRDISLSTKILYDPNDYDSLVEEDRGLLEIYNEFELHTNTLSNPNDSKWILRIELDKIAMMDRNIRMDDVYNSTKNLYGDTVKCIYSDDNAAKVIFRIRISEEITKSDKKKNTIGQFDEDDTTILRALEKNLMDNIIIRGVKNIRNIIVSKVDQNVRKEINDYKRFEQWILETDGINMLDVCMNKDVDFTKTYSNDIHEIYENLGIEAARHALLKEIDDVIKFEGAYVNYRHLSLLCDIMTTKGALMSIDRHGINRSDNGPLAKSSFEETTDQLLKAAMFGDSDKINGVSANIMMGQVAPCGTGSFDVLLDESMLADVNVEESEDESLDDYDENIDCNIDDFKFDINIDSIKDQKVPDFQGVELTVDNEEI